jgi:hypothetical protein
MPWAGLGTVPSSARRQPQSLTQLATDKIMTTKKSSKSRARAPIPEKKPRRSGPLVRSPAAAERESDNLRRGRERLDSTGDEGDVRATLF